MDIKDLSDMVSESGVIGTLIVHPEYAAHSEFLRANHFVNEENAHLFKAINDLALEGITNIDAYNVSTRIAATESSRAVLEKYNMPSVQDSLELYRQVARDSIQEYKELATNVSTLAYKRELVSTLNRAITSCYDKQNTLDALSADVYQDLDKLTEKYLSTKTVQTLGDQIDDIWETIVKRRTSDGVYGIPSKYEAFADYFTYEPGELVVIQARYKQGKSVFLMNEAVHKLQNGIPVLVVDTEMTTRIYTERLLALLTGINVNKIKSGDYGQQESERLREKMRWLKKQPFVHIYNPDMTMEELYSVCKIMQNKTGLGFVVYDYLKSDAPTAEKNYNALGAMCNFLKNQIAGKLDIPVLAAAQLNRNYEVADSDKINRYESVGIKWGYKPVHLIAKDGLDCGNAYAKIYVNRLGRSMQEDDEDDYIDFQFSGDNMTIIEAKQHERSEGQEF